MIIVDVRPVLGELLSKVVCRASKVIIYTHTYNRYNRTQFIIIDFNYIGEFITYLLRRLQSFSGSSSRSRCDPSQCTDTRAVWYNQIISLSWEYLLNTGTSINKKSTWKMMASRSSCDQVLNIVLMISRNFSLSRTLGSSFLKYWMKSYKIKYVPGNFWRKI